MSRLRTCRVCSRDDGVVKFSGVRLVCNPCRGSDYYSRNRDKVIASSKSHYAQNRVEINAEKARRNRENPDLRRDECLRSNYGITLAEYRQMHVDQGGGCLICGREMETLFVDHCHTTGVVRGLLCPQCNSGIGYFRDDPDLLGRAIDYLSPSRLRECA